MCSCGTVSFPGKHQALGSPFSSELELWDKGLNAAGEGYPPLSAGFQDNRLVCASPLPGPALRCTRHEAAVLAQT